MVPYHRMSFLDLTRLSAVLATLAIPASLYAQTAVDAAGGPGATPESILLASGPLGAVIVALSYALFRVSKRLDEVQESRTKDAQEMARAGAEANEKLSEALGRIAAEMQRQNDKRGVPP